MFGKTNLEGQMCPVELRFTPDRYCPHFNFQILNDPVWIQIGARNLGWESSIYTSRGFGGDQLCAINERRNKDDV